MTKSMPEATAVPAEAIARPVFRGQLTRVAANHLGRPVTTGLAALRGRVPQEPIENRALASGAVAPAVSQFDTVGGSATSGDAAAAGQSSAAEEVSIPLGESAAFVGSGSGVFSRGKSISSGEAAVPNEKSKNSEVMNSEGNTKKGSGVLVPGRPGPRDTSGLSQTFVAKVQANNEALATAVARPVEELIAPTAKEVPQVSLQESRGSGSSQGESQTRNAAQPDGTSMSSSDSKKNGAEAGDPEAAPSAEQKGLPEFPTKAVDRPETNRLAGGIGGSKPSTTRRVEGQDGLVSAASADPGGTLDAKQVSAMALSAKSESGSSPFGKNIPRVGRNDSYFSLAEQNPSLLESREARADVLGSERPSAALLVNPSAGSETLKSTEHRLSNSVDAVSSRSIRLAEEVWSAVESFRATSGKDWEVRIRPDAETQLNLKLTVHENQLHIHAKLESGNWEAMGPRWNELQALFAERGAQLRPLELSVTPGWNGQPSGQFGFAGHEQRQSAFESARREEFAETGARFSEEPAQQRKTTKATPAKSGAAWETWA